MRNSMSIDLIEKNDGQEAERLVFLDSLRALVIFLVIAIHISIAYLKLRYGIWGWVYNPKTNPVLFGTISLLLEGPLLMSIMFFIAGYFTLPSLAGHGSLNFIKGKLKRIALPWIAGVAILAPLEGCICMYSSGMHGTFMDYIKAFFTPLYWGQYQFWFLGVLLYLFLITALIYAIFGKKIPFAGVRAGNSAIPAFIGLIFINFCTGFVINLFTGAQSWTIKYFIQFQDTKLPSYIAYFILGMYAYKRDWFKSGYKPRILPWTLILVPSFLMLYVINLKYKINPVTVAQKLCYNAALSITVLAYVFFLLALSQKFLNIKKPLIKTISDNSFAVYVIHMHILLGVLHFSKNIDIPLFIKYILQLSFVSVSAWVLAYWMKKLPVLKKVL